MSEKLSKQTLDILFINTRDAPRGGCPLPEPGKDKIPIIEHVGHIDIQNQPKGFDYDRESNQSEAGKYLKFVKEALKKGEISKSEANKLMKLR